MSPTEAGGAEARFGRLRFLSCDDPAVFWVEAHGVITPQLLRQDLAAAEEFGRRHPGGWAYVADTTGVRGVHPWNPVLLRRVPGLPNLAQFLVLAPNRFLRLGLRLGAPIVRAERVFAARVDLERYLELVE